jgi:hypothetical protein
MNASGITVLKVWSSVYVVIMAVCKLNASSHRYIIVATGPEVGRLIAGLLKFAQAATKIKVSNAINIIMIAYSNNAR